MKQTLYTKFIFIILFSIIGLCSCDTVGYSTISYDSYGNTVYVRPVPPPRNYYRPVPPPPRYYRPAPPPPPKPAGHPNNRPGNYPNKPNNRR